MKCSSLLHSVTSCPVLANQSPIQNRQLQPYRQPYQPPHRFIRPNLMYSNYSVPRQYHQPADTDLLSQLWNLGHSPVKVHKLIELLNF